MTRILPFLATSSIVLTAMLCAVALSVLSVACYYAGRWR